MLDYEGHHCTRENKECNISNNNHNTTNSYTNKPKNIILFFYIL